MGIPINLIATVNPNDIVHRTFKSGDYSLAKEVRATWASAMDIQVSKVIRITAMPKLELGHDKIVWSDPNKFGPAQNDLGPSMQGFIYCKKSETMPISKFKMEKLCQS